MIDEWPQFDEHPLLMEECIDANPHLKSEGVFLTRDQYEYARIRVEACKGIPDESLWILSDNDRTLQMYISELEAKCQQLKEQVERLK